MNISVIGCGRWGSFLAWYLNKLSHNIILYGRENSVKFKEFIQRRTNGLVTLSEHIKLSSDIRQTITHAETIVISINSQNLRELMKQISQYPLEGKTILLCMKGLEEDTCKRLSEIVYDYTGNSVKTAIWVGPGHVQLFLNGIPNCMVIDSVDDKIKNRLVNAFSNGLIRFYYGNDMIGNEIGAASKNVIGIAAGMLDGLNKSSLKGALMSRGTREISRLIRVMGGNELSAYGLCHLGDYEATVFSEFSQNRKFGENIVLHRQYDKLAEGASTVKALVKLGRKYGIELPICEAVYAVVHEGQDPNIILSEMFLRSIKSEF